MLLLVKVEESKIVIELMKSTFLALGGAYKIKSPIAAEKIRDYIRYSEKK